ncbi:unnamed protein product [Withania somnifera]
MTRRFQAPPPHNHYRHHDLLLLRNDLDRFFRRLTEDREWLERDIRRISRILQVIVERLDIDPDGLLTPPPSP